MLPDGIILQGFHWEATTPDARYPETWPDGKVGTSWYVKHTTAVSRDPSAVSQGSDLPNTNYTLFLTAMRTCRYKTLEEKVKEMADCGITDIWLPPPSQSVAR